MSHRFKQFSWLWIIERQKNILQDECQSICVWCAIFRFVVFHFLDKFVCDVRELTEFQLVPKNESTLQVQANWSDLILSTLERCCSNVRVLECMPHLNIYRIRNLSQDESSFFFYCLLETKVNRRRRWRWQ